MAKCEWCDRELPATGANVCPSCVFKSVDELKTSEGDDSEKEDEKGKVNYDLAWLKTKKARKRRTVTDVNAQLLQETRKRTPKLVQENPMRKVKVQSNSIRGRTFVVDGELVLSFDKDGVAECDASDIPRIRAYSRVRPGRIWVKAAEAATPAPAPEPKKVEVKKAAPAKVEEKDEEKKAEKVARAAERAAKVAERKEALKAERKSKVEAKPRAKKPEKAEKKDEEKE